MTVPELPQLTPCNGCEKLWRPERLYVLGIPSDPPTISRLCPACFGGAVRMMIAAEDDGAEMAVRRLVGVKGALEGDPDMVPGEAVQD